MIVNQVKVEVKRTLPTNQWEYNIISLDTSLEEGDVVSDVIQSLKKLCLEEHNANITGGRVSLTSVAYPVESGPVQQELPIKEEKPVKEEPKKVEKKTKAKPETKVTSKPLPEEAKEKAEVKPVEVKEEPKKATKLKNIVYDRTNDLHKNHVGKLLDGIDPKWRAKYEKAAVAASKGMAGQEFMDSEGNILDSFKEGLMKIFNENR